MMRSIAFCPESPKIARMILACCKMLPLLAFAAAVNTPCLRAQEAAAPPPKEERPGKPPPDQHRPGGMRPGMGFSGGGGFFPRGDHERMDAFKDLSESEREKVRAAFEKAWKNVSVTEARDRLTKANDDYRQALHHALEEADPEVVKILEKAKPPVPHLPDPNDPEFPKKAIARLGMELQFWAQQEKRDMPTSRLHERVMNAPAVRDLIKQLEAAEPGKRLELWNRVREAYQTAARNEFGHPPEGRRDGPRRDEPRGEHPPPPPPDGEKRP